MIRRRRDCRSQDPSLEKRSGRHSSMPRDARKSWNRVRIQPKCLSIDSYKDLVSLVSCHFVPHVATTADRVSRGRYCSATVKPLHRATTTQITKRERERDISLDQLSLCPTYPTLPSMSYVVWSPSVSKTKVSYKCQIASTLGDGVLSSS